MIPHTFQWVARACCCCPRQCCSEKIIHVFFKQVFVGRQSVQLETDKAKTAVTRLLFYPVLNIQVVVTSCCHHHSEHTSP